MISVRCDEAKLNKTKYVCPDFWPMNKGKLTGPRGPWTPDLISIVFSPPPLTDSPITSPDSKMEVTSSPGAKKSPQLLVRKRMLLKSNKHSVNIHKQFLRLLPPCMAVSNKKGYWCGFQSGRWWRHRPGMDPAWMCRRVLLARTLRAGPTWISCSCDPPSLASSLKPFHAVRTDTRGSAYEQNTSFECPLRELWQRYFHNGFLQSKRLLLLYDGIEVPQSGSYTMKYYSLVLKGSKFVYLSLYARACVYIHF